MTAPEVVVVPLPHGLAAVLHLKPKPKPPPQPAPAPWEQVELPPRDSEDCPW